MNSREKRNLLAKADEYLPATIHMFAAGRVGQKSMESSNVKKKLGLRGWERAEEMAKSNKNGGATTSSLLKALYGYNRTSPAGGVTCVKLLEDIRKSLKDVGYEHVPQLCSSRPIEDNEKFCIIPKNKWEWTAGGFKGKKRALIIGIKYSGEGYEIPGSHNDAWNMVKYLRDTQGFKNDEITILMDDGTQKMPYASTIKKEMYKFGMSLHDGDVGYFHFSGHGAQLGDNQVLMGVHDGYPQNKQYVEDNEIFRLMLLPLSAGVKLTAVIDCCHSGHMFNLPFQCLDGDLHTDIYKPRFVNAKYVPMERMKVESIKSIGMPASDMESMLLPHPQAWKDRTLGEGWDDFYKYKPPAKQRSIGIRRVVRRNASTVSDDNDNADDRSVFSLGALDRKNKRRPTSNSGGGGMSGLTGFSTNRRKVAPAPPSQSDDRSVSSMGAIDKRKKQPQRAKSLFAANNNNEQDSNKRRTVRRNKSTMSSDVDCDDRSVSSMGALDKRRRSKSGAMGNRKKEKPSLSEWKATFDKNDDGDDRSVASMGALDKRRRNKKPARSLSTNKTKKVSSSGMGDLTGFSSTGSSRREKPSLSEWKAKFDKNDDDGDRSVCSMGALDKRKKKKKSAGSLSTNTSKKMSSGMGDLTGFSSGGSTDRKKRPGMKRVGSAHQLGTSSAGRAGRRSQRKSGRSDDSSVVSRKNSSLFNNKGTLGYDDDDDYDNDDRSVSSMGALDKKKKAARLKRNSAVGGDLTGISTTRQKRSPSVKTSIKKKYDEEDDDDDRSVLSMGALPRKKHMPRNSSMNGLSGMTNGASGAAPVKKRPGLQRVGSAHQLGGHGRPRKHRPGELGSLSTHGTPKKHMPGSYLPGGLSTNNRTPKKHMPGSLGSYSMHTPAGQSLRNGSNDQVPKQKFKYKPLSGGGTNSKKSSLSTSTHSTSSFYTAASEYTEMDLHSFEEESEDNKPPKWRKEVALGSSASSFVSDVTEDDASLSEDDDDEFLMGTQPKRNPPKRYPSNLSADRRAPKKYMKGTKPPPLKKQSSREATKKTQPLSVSNHSGFFSCASAYTTDADDTFHGDSCEEFEVKPSSNMSMMSDVTDACFDDDDDDDDKGKPPSQKFKCHSITDIRNARRRQTSKINRNHARGHLDSILMGLDDADPDFSGLGESGLGIRENPKKRAPPNRTSSTLSRKTVH